MGKDIEDTLDEVLKNTDNVIDVMMIHINLIATKGKFDDTDKEMLLQCLKLLMRGQIQESIIKISAVVKKYKDQWMNIDEATSKAFQEYVHHVLHHSKKNAER